MEIRQHLIPICSYNKHVYYVCINPKCKQLCFICDNKCQCKVLHKKCEKVDWDYLYGNLDKNTIKNTNQFKSFSDSVDQLYQNTIKIITKAYDDFKIWRDDFGLTESQSAFLKLIQEGKFSELASAKMYEMRKEINTPYKIILKSQSKLKQQTELINNYTEKVIQLFKGLYSQNKVVKEQKMESKKQDKNNQNNQGTIKIVQHIQSKVNLVHKLLGLNENGSRFFTMINQGVIERQLEKILDKINLNEESINKNTKAIYKTKQVINKNQQVMDQRIKNITEKIKENNDSLKIETKQIKQEISNFHKIFQVDRKIKISNQITKITKKFNTLGTKIKNLKGQIIGRQLEIQSKELKLFSQYFLKETQFKLKNEFLKKLEALQIKNSKLLNEQVKDDIPSNNLIDQLTKLEKEITDIQQQMKIKINQMLYEQVQSIKIDCISKFFTMKLKKLNLLYRASENNFQVRKFWDKCNGKTNTLTILKTQFGKIIGGYTPFAWNKNIGTYQQDTSKETFLFSITQKHKIPIFRNQGNATYHNASYGPTFSADLNIYDKAKVTGNSFGNIGFTYNNGEYSYGSQQAHKKWSGQSNGYNFRIQQWQVYEVTFEY